LGFIYTRKGILGGLFKKPGFEHELHIWKRRERKISDVSAMNQPIFGKTKYDINICKKNLQGKTQKNNRI
jgi:hypothetical protein